ncbi:MAG: phytanoyl-CoA dioxygenase [Marmoricola sp.]|jgi:ectoine hydroxylase-related dioxygenase (phytanoyl-CoA dioxygenase family)|nr:phytanoyl-CoA dioxygenase [Marmoricola sp.]
MNPHHYAPQLLLTTAYRNAVRLAAQLLGDRVTFEGMHAIRNPARSGAATPWHQDQAYWDPHFEHFGITVWAPLQPATLENGCMQFVPRSHHLGVQPHELISPDSHGLRLTAMDAVKAVVACPLPAGGATVHFCRTLHYTGPNTTTGPRRALIVDFKAPPVPLPEPRSMPWRRPEWSE